MSPESPPRLHPFGPLAYAAVGFLLLGLGWAIIDMQRSARKSERRIERTLTALGSVARIDQHAGKVELAQRNYLMTREAEFLADREAAITDLRRALGEARRIFSTGRKADLMKQLSERVEERAGQMERLKPSVRDVADERMVRATASRIYDLTGALHHEAVADLFAA